MMQAKHREIVKLSTNDPSKLNKTITFNFELRGVKTIITGESGSGKTFFINAIRDLIDSSGKVGKCNIDHSKFYVVSMDSDIKSADEYVSKLSENRGKIIIIDEGHSTIKKFEKRTHYIERDIESTYVIMYRDTSGLSFGTTPANIAEIESKTEGNNTEFRLFYRYDFGGW